MKSCLSELNIDNFNTHYTSFSAHYYCGKIIHDIVYIYITATIKNKEKCTLELEKMELYSFVINRLVNIAVTYCLRKNP